MLGDMGNKRVVRILLECILVVKYSLNKASYLESKTEYSFHRSTDPILTGCMTDLYMMLLLTDLRPKTSQTMRLSIDLCFKTWS